MSRLFLLLLLAACHGKQHKGTEPPTPTPQPEVTIPDPPSVVREPINLTEECVVLKPVGERCAAGETPLFRGQGPSLDRFCTRPSSTPCDPDAYDAAVIYPQADVSELWDLYADMTVGFGGLSAQPLPSGKRDADVAVIDTSPTLDFPDALTTPGDNRHGQMVANLVHRAACGPMGVQDGCAVKVRTVKGLDYIKSGGAVRRVSNEPASMGSWLDLARAIDEAVQTSANPERLVINLSLGWHPLRGGEGPRESWPVAIEAVFVALSQARCRGARILAAAGNNSGADTATNAGALLPAAWSVGQVATCDDGRRLDLLMAIGGVEARIIGDKADSGPAWYPLALTRKGSMPPFAAYGRRAAPERVPPGGPAVTLAERERGTWPLTGTSASTAIASGAAGAWIVLSNDGDLDSAFAGMSEDTSIPAELRPVRSVPTVRVLRPCMLWEQRGIDDACVPATMRVPEEDERPDELDARVCEDTRCAPEERIGSYVHGSTIPQPSQDICPLCYIQWNGTLGKFHVGFASFTKMGVPGPLFQPTLVLTGPNGPVYIAMDPAKVLDTADAPYLFTVPALTAWLDGQGFAPPFPVAAQVQVVDGSGVAHVAELPEF